MTLTIDQAGNVTIIHLPEKFIDALNAQNLKIEIQNHLKPKMQLIVDFSHVEFIDSSGLGVILSSMRHLAAMGGQLKLAGVSKSVRTLFELVRFHRIIEIYDTIDEALKSFKQ